ncbi:MAG: alanine racemase [Thermodesulfobacteriota bacterium]|nr:alanine racemase [Thermodesulfobacteriota bacterium]
MNRPTVAEIDLDAFRFNYIQIRNRVDINTRILAVVKADGYGHGALFLSKELEELGVDLLGVAICEEAIALRKAGIKIPIIILNGIFKGQVEETFEYKLTPVIYDLHTARSLSDRGKSLNRKIKVHVKIDTGMGRVGILPEGLRRFFTSLKTLSNIEIEGVLSHLSTASGDSPEDKCFASLQIKRFEDSLKEIKKLGISPPLMHIANSSATTDMLPSSCNTVRPGLMLYGAYPCPRFADMIELKPVMRLKTEIAHIKRVSSGYGISYGRTFRTRTQSSIGTLPIGYADGYNRLLSNCGSVLIRGKKSPVVGSVCMDMIMVDVTDVPNVKEGDEVVLIGRQGDCEIAADDIAKKIGTISYEVFCNLSRRVPRVYIKDGKEIGKGV